MDLAKPLHSRVFVALVSLVGRFVGIALPSQLKDFNLKMTFMLRLVVIAAAALSITNFDIPASFALLVMYIVAAEALQWKFPEHDFPGQDHEEDAASSTDMPRAQQ